MADIHGENFSLDTGFTGLQLSRADSGRVIERCVFDARALLPQRASFAAIQTPEDGELYKLTLRDCIIYNFDKGVCCPANADHHTNGIYIQNCDIAYCRYGIHGINTGYLTLVGGCLDVNDVALWLPGAQGCKIMTHLERNGLDLYLDAASHDNWLMCDAPGPGKIRNQGQNNRVNFLTFSGYPKT